MGTTIRYHFVRGIIKFPVAKGPGKSAGPRPFTNASRKRVFVRSLCGYEGTVEATQTATPYSDSHLVLGTVLLDLSWNKQAFRGNVITGAT